MHIVRMYIDRFGIFRNCLAEDLSPGLVVIEGPNRAGKTTLMRLIRHLPFGFTGSGLPGDVKGLQAEADVVDGSHRYRVKLHGKRTPHITPLDGAPEIPDERLSAGLGEFAFAQLFTISLDELRSAPAGLKPKDLRELRIVLLGGGLGQTLQLPTVIKGLDDVADSIGATQGRARQLGDERDRIRDAIGARDEALASVPEHRRLCGQRDRLTGEIGTARQQLDGVETEVRRLELVAHCFDDVLKLRRCRDELARIGSPEWLDAFPANGREELQRLRDELAESEQQAATAELYLQATRQTVTQPDLLAVAQDVERVHGQASGLREQCRRQHELGESIRQQREDMARTLRQLVPDSAGELEVLERMRVDLVSRDRLATAVEQLESHGRALADCDQKLQDNARRQDELRQELEEVQPAEQDEEELSLDELRERRALLDGWLDAHRQAAAHDQAAAAARQWQKTLGPMLAGAGNGGPVPWIIGGLSLIVAVVLGVTVQWYWGVIAVSAGGSILAGMLWNARAGRAARAAQTRQLDEDVARRREAADQLAQQMQQQAREAGLPADVTVEAVRADLQRSETLIARAAETGSLRGRRQHIAEELAKATREADDLQQRRPGLAEAQQEANKQYATMLKSLGLPGDVQPATAIEFCSQMARLVAEADRAVADEATRRAGQDQLEPRLEASADVLARAGFAVTPPAGGWSVEPGPLFERLAEAKANLDEAEQRQQQVKLAETQHAGLKQQTERKRARLCNLLKRGLVDEVDDLPEAMAAFGQRTDQYEQIAGLRNERAELRGRVLAALGTTAAARVLGAESAEPEVLLTALEGATDAFASGAEPARALAEARGRHDTRQTELGELQKQQGQLSGNIERLAADDALREAQERIETHRERMRQMALRYATHRLAAELLREVHHRSVAEAYGPLLQDATDAFRQITDGAYEAIDTHENVAEGGFTVTPADAQATQTPEVLSRATEEQLFLAVRLSRIRRIDPPLPVVIDDSLVNFDPAGRRAALAVIRELVRTHQVFLLTCHPEMTRLAAQTVADAQVWQLEAGKMSRTERD